MPLSRSQQMGRVRGVDTTPERMLRSALWRRGLRYNVQRRISRTRVDIVFVRSRVAVFVDGCFWHGCPDHYSRPRSSTAFWSAKLTGNVERDRRQTVALEHAGWSVLRIWEHDILSDVSRVATLVRAAMLGHTVDTASEWRAIRVVPVPRKGPDWERRELCLLRDASVRRIEVGPRQTGSSKARATRRQTFVANANRLRVS